MCELSTALLVASLVTTAAAGAYSADASKKMGQYQAEVAGQNAEIADAQAQQAATIGSIQEERARSNARQMIGKQRAALAAGGGTLDDATSVDLVAETALFGEEDALMARFNAMNDAWGFRTKAVDYRNQGSAARVRGRNEARGTYLTTAGSMISTGTSYYNSRG